MLGILLIYFIGKRFYDLALQYQKSGWGFGILGVIIFYASQLFFGLILGIMIGVNEYGEFEGISDFALNLIGIVVGLLGVVALYHVLKKVWSKKSYSGDLLDEDFL